MLKKISMISLCGLVALAFGCSGATAPTNADLNKIDTGGQAKVRELERKVEAGEIDATEIDTKGSEMIPKGGPKKALPNTPPQ